MTSTPKRSDERELDTHDTDHDAADVRDTDESIDVAITSEPPARSRDTERDLDPPNSRSVTARSRTEMAGKSDKGDKEDTLLSVDEDSHAAASTDRADPALEELDRRVLQLEARIKVMEMQRGERPVEDRRWLFWVGLLLALALGWQLRAFFE